MVEAAGVEPAPPQNANWLMARDFRRKCLVIRCLVVNLLSSGVLWSPLESSPVLETLWRRAAPSAVAQAVENLATHNPGSLNTTFPPTIVNRHLVAATSAS
jgi:hypothetical protein